MNPTFGGPHMWGGRGPGGGGMFGPFSGAFDAPEDPQRLAREDRILPALPALREGVLPGFHKDALKSLVADLKEEGNSLFREKQYVLAGEYYTYALTLARNMEIQLYCYVERELLSTIFSNRAACCLKLDYHDDAVRDTEFAISLNKDNIKAYFRKATALKAKKNWTEALVAAEDGQAKATSKNRAQENKEFSEIIREISSHLPKPVFEEQRNFASAARQQPAATKPQPIVPPPQQPKSSSISISKPPQPAPVVVKATASATGQSGHASGQNRQTSPIDESWLQGTTVDVAIKASSTTQDKTEKTKKKRRKGKMKTKTVRVNNSANRFAYLESSESESDSSGQNESESEEENFEDVKTINKRLPQSVERPKVNGFNAKQKKKAASADDGFGMGLDDFAIPGGLNREIGVPQSSSSGSVQSLQSSQSAKSHNGHQQTEYKAPPPQVAAPIQVAPVSRRMKPPLDAYEFKLACSKCFVKLGDGILGYRHHPMLSHPCAMDLLLLRLLHDNGGIWLRIRPRPNRDFPGKYRMCQHFLSDRPCRVTEENCSFAHSQAEIDAWSAERVDQIDLIAFIADQRNQVHASAAQRLARAEPVAPPAQPNLPNRNQRPPLYGNGGNGLGGPPPGPPPNNLGPKVPRFQQPQPVQEMPLEVIPFPLKDQYNFKLTCTVCLRPAEYFGFYTVQNVSHICAEEILTVKEKGALYWMMVRERRNHRMFPGNYMECRYFCNRIQPTQCPVGIENCSFAHNLPEQILWTLEKDGVFNIQEFMIQNKIISKGLTLEEVFHKHEGRFQFLCGVCFFGHLIHFQRNPNDMVCSNTKTPHQWLESRVLVHVSFTGNIELIANRPFTHKTAFYLLCHRQKYCAKRVSRECKFAHSLVERDLWVLERDTEWSRDMIVREYAQLLLAATTLQLQNAVGCAQHSPVEGSPVRQQAVEPSLAAPPVPERCPFKVIAICAMCWKNGVRSDKDGVKDRCTAKNRSHIWSLNIAYLLIPQNKIIRPLPKKIPNQLNFIICRHIREKRNCDYSAGNCQFAHSEDEIEIWKWMVKNLVKTLAELLESAQQKPAPNKLPASPAKKIPEGQSVVTAAWAQQPAQLRPQATSMPLDLVQNAHYCHYCSVSCNSEKQWVEHCASDKHMFNVNSDKEHQWNYRQPPWGISANQYEVCPRHQEGRCRYSHLPDMYNLCKYAHSQEELDEWKERWEWRQMKREMARQEGVYSYMEELLEDFDQAQSALSVITEELPDVEIKVTADLKIYKNDKNATHSWDFYVCHKKGLQLERVALLQNKDRLHFVLFGEDLNDTCQIASGDSFLAPECSGNTYKVRVLFKGGMFGSFMQWVSFDFGGRPVLVRKLNVELGMQNVQEKVKQLRAKLNFDRWTAENREIVSFDTRTSLPGELETELLKTHKAPTSADAIVNQQTIGVELNRHNYVHKMKKMLQLEELTRHHIISSYNLKTDIELINMINESTLIYVRSGELFARVPLNNQLSEDTDAGKLILTSVRNILIAPIGSKNRQVYEAIIVQKDNFDYDGRGKEYIYICLSQRCCSDLELSAGGHMQVEIQFQMNRLPFCFMHYALSCLESTDKVFPDVSKINPEWHEKHTHDICSSVLNNDQMKVIKHVIAQRSGYAPPLILYGPFGTGKTETMAQAALLLLQQQMDVRILICTHSNSAADLYILKHFDEYARKNKEKGLPVPILRVYALERRLNTVPPQIQSYCLIAHDRASFVAPTAQDIRNHRVVITTLHTSLVLSQMGLHDQFTHIFIDEAGQALETEIIMPITLASEQTCIVLGGDHMQMSPHVYSREAKRQGFHRSLLERLYRHYENYSVHLDQTNQLNILLSVNYRSKMEILRFISAVFYGSPDALKSRSSIPNTSYVPLTFYAAQGREVQDADSTSYYNMAEIEEVVDRVEELYENWPEAWGPRKASSIGIVTPYFDQVSKIRVSLRRRKRELREVTVERVMNVQGKEFQVLFISTVRTRHIADTAPRRVLNSPDCDGEVGDFGFLSDPKLLNTAFTRAQSMVAVVGDPVALCSIGECMSVWRTFLKHCQNLNSIYPNNITLDSIKSQVVSLMNAPEGENLRQLALLYRSVKQGVMIDGEEENDSDSDDVEDNKTLRKLMADEYEDQNPFDTLVKGGFFDDWSLEYHVEPDDIIKQLAKEVVKVKRKSSNEGKSKKNVQLELEDTPLKIECIKVQEEEGHAVVTYDPNKSSDEPRKRRLRGADDCDADFDSGSDVSDTEDVSERMVYTEYSVKQLNDFLANEPTKYKRCIFKIENSQRMFAKIVDASVQSNKGEIKICSRLHCGRAFNNDEVVVEVINKEEEEEPDEDSKEIKEMILVGKVTGILKRSINPKYRMFVCRVEQDNTGLMVPLNRGIPKIYNLETHNRMMKSRKGHVCVYTFTKDREIIFHHYEPIDCTNPDAKLFIVRYLKWEAKFYSPLGIVVGVLPAGDTVENGMKILNIEHYVSSKFKEDTFNDVNRLFHSNYQIPETAYANRTDCRSKLTFTVDPPGSEDLDDALSIETQPNGKYVIGVHIADVSYFIKKDSCLDTEAKTRGMTFYPVGERPVHMIPERLATDLCSLVPDKDRLVMSLFITVNHEGAVERVQTRRCIIKSKYRLTYEDAEGILKRRLKWDSDLMLNVFMLHRIAQMWRRKRLGNLGLYQQFDHQASQTPEAHLMVEEIMINANHLVADLLLQKFNFVPLRNQLNPNDLEMDAWRGSHATAASNSLALKNPFLPLGSLCRCQGVCTCVPAPNNDEHPVSVSLEVVEKLKDAVATGDPDAVRRIVLDPLRHPDQAVALVRLWQIQERSAYVCSGDIPEQERRHHSLNVFGYTHFTSPIRRYIDLIVHRMIEAHIDNQPSPYSQNDVRTLCDQMTDAAIKAARYEQATHSLHLSAVLQKHSIILYPVVESITEQHIQLSFPTVGDLTASKGRVKLSHLNPAERPEYEESTQKLAMKFSCRIYDNSKDRTVFFKSNTVQLNPNKFTMQMSRGMWQQMVEAIQQEDRKNLLSLATKAIQELQQPSGAFGYDVTSEVPSGAVMNHFSQFGLHLAPCTVMRVQVGADLVKGFLSPRVQLVNLTPRLDICLEHRSDPITCFAGITNIQASKQNYGDVESYQRSWLPVLGMEAARNTATCEDAALIHSVEVKWYVHRGKKGNNYTGSFSLPTLFCHNRQLRFSGITGGDASPWGTDEEIGEAAALTERVYDFLCIRYRNLVISEEPDTTDLKVDINTESPVSWVGHCVSTKAIANKKEMTITVYFKLHQSSMPFPEDLLKNSGILKATIEWIPKSLPYRRMEKGIYDLSRATQLVKDIALGRNPEPRANENYNLVPELLERDLSPMSSPNHEQQKALQTALLKPFTLIQGPPGTGKTVTSARLAVLYVLMNRMQPPLPENTAKNKDKTSPQILYCGPSNKSVDVVAGYLKRLGHQCPRMVRVYGESIERQEFPLPNDPSMHRRRTGDAAMDPNLKGIALHHLIRMEGKKHSRQILEYDDFFRSKPEQVSQQQVSDYLRLLSQAEAEEIMNSEIILCTASSASAGKIVHSCNVTQIIVDECGMCTELETLIPLVAHKAHQVVLVGDHQQLRPIVMDDTARNLGLERSMFERYSDKAIMLTTQYRMHEAISYFPSHHFYKDMLQCGRNEQTKPSTLKFWPNGRDQPIAFIHVAGKEETQSVATADGSEQSKSNLQEATQAARVSRLLVRRFHARPEDVVVLTQYRAQAAEVRRQLLEKGEPDIGVSTVVASQGSEWDYVVLSTVRSLPHNEIEERPTNGWRKRNLGFIMDQHQINVGITRARKGLIIIGNRHLLQCDGMWKNLLDLYDLKKKIVNAKDFMTLGK